MEEAKLRVSTPRDLTVFQHHEAPGDWRVEYLEEDGAGYVTIFAGPSAEARARDYFEAMQFCPLELNFLSVKNLATVEPWHSLAVRNTPDTLSASRSARRAI
jgi:hypothetical protein